MLRAKLRAVWGASRGSGWAMAVLLGTFACAPLGGTPETVAGDAPNVNQMTSARQKSLPYCPGGHRNKSCVLGENCRVTEQGCQVCECQSLQ